jgi:dynein heavy chain
MSDSLAVDVLLCLCLQVHAEATKIAKETEDANIIATQVSLELDKALPALQAAEAALAVLEKKDISELKVLSTVGRLHEKATCARLLTQSADPLLHACMCVCLLQAYSKPPTLVDKTLSGVMTVLRRPGNWEEAKKALGDANFMGKLMHYDKVCLQLPAGVLGAPAWWTPLC